MKKVQCRKCKNCYNSLMYGSYEITQCRKKHYDENEKDLNGERIVDIFAMRECEDYVKGKADIQRFPDYAYCN